MPKPEDYLISSITTCSEESSFFKFDDNALFVAFDVYIWQTTKFILISVNLAPLAQFFFKNNHHF